MTTERSALTPEQAQRVVQEIAAILSEQGNNKARAGRLLKITPQALSKILEGRNSPSMRTASRVAHLRNVPVADLLELSKPSTRPLQFPVSGGEQGESMGRMLQLSRGRFPRLEALAISDEGRKVQRWSAAVVEAARCGLFGDEDHTTDEWEAHLDELQELYTRHHPPDSRRAKPLHR